MEYKRGDSVEVQGFMGKRAVLRVWEANSDGVWLCTEKGFVELNQGYDAPVVGFPHKDVKEKVDCAQIGE